MTGAVTLAGQLDAEARAREVADARLLKWLRREVNRDMRRWRPAARAGDAGAAERVADCKSKLAMLAWADGWQQVLERGFTSDADVRARLLSSRVIVMHAVRITAAAYRGREGWREEWEKR